LPRGRSRSRSTACASLRETSYDLAAAAAELRASGFPDANSQLTESLLDPVDADLVTALFEHAAGRGEHPGPPPATPARE
jgi:hypothetical protein